ncbi:MAG: MOSC domain-containing protein [Oligoflexus sp.]|nr:MOSC domain-containing protein [Oligoflexus sp.]
MKILSILTGKPQTVTFRGKVIDTGIFKSASAGPIMLRTTNLDGDGQADLKVHGGRDKALYAYPFDIYDAWRDLRPQDKFEMGAFGENLCMDELNEKAIYLGDSFRVGKAVIQVTEPRFPCFKLGIKFEDPKIVEQFMTMGRPGVYYRVLEEGLLSIGDEMELIDREEVLVSVQEIFEMESEPDPVRLLEILKVQSLNEHMRRKYREYVDDV